MTDLSHHPIGDLLKSRIQINDQLGALNEDYKHKSAHLKNALEKLDSEMLKRMQADGIQRQTIDGVGTMSIRVSTKAGSDDWQLTRRWLFDQMKAREAVGEDPLDVFGYLHKRMSGDVVQTYIETHNGAVPPGVSVFAERTVIIKPLS
jgi:hypothetical protein